MTLADNYLAKRKEQLQDFFNNLPYKPNPHNYPIVNKWNHKYVYATHRAEIFEMVEETITEYMKLKNADERQI